MFLITNHNGAFSALETKFSTACVRAEAIARLTGKPAFVYVNGGPIQKTLYPSVKDHSK